MFTTRASLVLMSAFAASLALNGCSAASQDDSSESDEDVSRNPNFAQLNDVSTLLPLAKTQNEFDAYLSASSNGVGGDLFPETVFDTATGAKPGGDTSPGGIGSSPTIQWKDLRVVAFRIDPCFANIGPVTDASKCDNQLRLLLQPLAFANSATTALDDGVHVFYSLTRDQLTALLQDVIKIRQENGGTKDLGELGVHPIIASQGLTGAEWKSLSADILKYAGSSNLMRFTEFQNGNLDTTWTFEGFDIAKGKPTPMVIPTLPSKGTSEEFFVGFGAGFNGGFTPSTNATDDMQVLGNTAAAGKASEADAQSAFDATLRIQNPGFHSPNTIDCASCHMAEPAQVVTGAQLKLSATGNANAFVANSKYIRAADMKEKTAENMTDGLNLHMFSYKDSNPMVQARVINESASIVTYLNSSVLTGK
jgi:hypothetical protein